MLRKAYMLFLAVAVLAPQAARAEIGDYDGDSKADFVAIQRNGNHAFGETYYLARPSGGGGAPYYRFPVRGDAMVHGRFFGNDRRFFPGVVFVRSAQAPLEWHIAAPPPAGQGVFPNPATNVLTFTYGLPGMRVPNQGDFDCDGVTDITVATVNNDGTIVWYIAQTSTGTVQGRVFGLASDTIGATDTDGDGCDNLVVLRVENGEYVWYSTALYSNTIDVVRWGLASTNDIPLLPKKLAKNKPVAYMVARRIGGIQAAFIRYSSSDWTTINLGRDTSVPMLGKYFSGMNFGWVQRDAGAAAARLPNGDPLVFAFGSPTNDLIAPDGTVTLSNQIPGAPGGGVGGPSGPCSTPNFPDGSGGALWKPDREGGSTGGDATYLQKISKNNANGDYTRIDKVQIVSRNSGQVVHTLRLRYEYGHGGRAVFDATVSNSSLNQGAPLIIRTQFDDGSCEDRSLPDAHRRYD